MARHKGDLFLHRHGQQFFGVHAIRHLRPEKEPSLRMGPGDAGRKVFFHGLEHHVAALLVDLADLAHVGADQAALADVIGNILDEGAGMQIRPLLGLHQPVDDRLGGHDPAQSQAGCQRLGEGAQVDRILLVQGADRGDILSLETELAVGIVFDDKGPVLRRQLHQAVAALQRQRGAGGVVKVGQHIDELGARIPGQRFFQLVHAHAVLVQGNGHIARAVDVPGLDSPQVGGPAGDDCIPLVDKDPAKEIQGLLRAVRKEHVAAPCRQLVAVHGVDDPILQLRKALCGAVLQRQLGIVIEDPPASILESAYGKDVRCGQTAGERDHFGKHGELEQLADDRALHARRAAGQCLLPARGILAVESALGYHSLPPCI